MTRPAALLPHLLVAIALASSGLSAQDVGTRVSPGDRVRVWLGGARLPLAGRVVDQREGALWIDSPGTTCAADGCGPARAPLVTISRLQIARGGARAAIPLAIAAGMAITLTTGSACARAGRLNSATCETLRFGGLAAVVTAAYVVGRDRWRDVTLPAVPGAPPPR